MAGASVMKEEVQPHWDASFSGESRRDVQGSLLLSSSLSPEKLSNYLSIQTDFWLL